MMTANPLQLEWQPQQSCRLSHRLASLRREKVYTTVWKEFIAELPVLLAGLPYTSDALFGKAFSKSVKKLAKKVRDKNTLVSELKPLSALHGKAKQGRKATSGRNNPGSAQANKGGTTGSWWQSRPRQRPRPGSRGQNP